MKRLYVLEWKRFCKSFILFIPFLCLLLYLIAMFFVCMAPPPPSVFHFIGQIGNISNRFGFIGFVGFLFLSYEFIHKSKDVCIKEIETSSNREASCVLSRLAVLTTGALIYYLFGILIFHLLYFLNFPFSFHFECNLLLACLLYVLSPTIIGMLLGTVFGLFFERLPFYFFGLLFSFFISDFSDAFVAAAGYFLASSFSVPVGVTFVKLTDIFGSLLPNKVANVNDAYGVPVEFYHWALVIFWVSLMISFIYLYLCPKKKAMKWAGSIALFMVSIIGLMNFMSPGSVCQERAFYTITDNIESDNYYYEALDSREFTGKEESKFYVTHYDMNFKFGKELQATVKAKIDNINQPQYAFTLYHGYVVQSITDADGNRIPYQREGDYIVINNEDKSVSGTIVFSYNGSQKNYYSNNQGAYLPGFFSYYPVEGIHTVFENGFFTTNFEPEIEKEISVTVSGIQGNVFTNLQKLNNSTFKGTSKSLTLVGGFYKEQIINQTIHILPEFRTLSNDPIASVQQMLDGISEVSGLQFKVPAIDYVFHSPSIILPVPYAGPTSIMLENTLLFYNNPIHPDTEKWLAEEIISSLIPQPDEKREVSHALESMLLSVLNGDQKARTEFLAIFGELTTDTYIYVDAFSENENKTREIQFYLYKALLGSEDPKPIFQKIYSYLTDETNTMTQLDFVKSVAEQYPYTTMEVQ